MIFSELLNQAVPKNTPCCLEKAVLQVKSASSKKEAVLCAYNLLNKRFSGGHIKTYLLLFRVFEKDLCRMWARGGYAHCTSLNTLLRVLLVKSGHFSSHEVRLVWTSVWFISPHQYVQVLIDNTWVDVDLWAHFIGIPFGKYARGFT